MDIQQLAEKCQKYLVRKTRDSGESFVCQSGDSPGWFHDLVHKAHIGTMPNDGSYNAIESAIDDIAGGLENPEPNLVGCRAWFNVYPDSDYYCDELLAEGFESSIDGLLTSAMFRHYLEVFCIVFDGLEEQIEEEE